MLKILLKPQRRFFSLEVEDWKAHNFSLHKKAHEFLSHFNGASLVSKSKRIMIGIEILSAYDDHYWEQFREQMQAVTKKTTLVPIGILGFFRSN